MSSFLKPNKHKSGKGFQIKPRGVQSDDRLRDAFARLDSQTAMKGTTPANPQPSSSSNANLVTPARRSCPNPRCLDPSAPVQEGYCSACGREIDTSNIVAEVQFGETSSGAAIVQGSYVGADQGAARTMGPAFRRIGGVIGDSRERTIREARQMMNDYAQQLKISESTVNVGVQIFKLAINENWIQGRGMVRVVPACLYTACRKEEKCKVMLIDFADLVKINVYELGHVFKALNDIYSFESNNVKSIIPEDLMFRFADKLDFGEFTNKIATDATRLCKRMGLDWMVMGRRPSGICGACILMAARMWNFRRTVKEVVYVVKVTTHTIEQRLEEFQVTESSDLSIEDFLHQELLESRHDPPSFYKKSVEWKEKEAKRQEESGRKRKRLEDDEGEGQMTATANGTHIAVPPPPQDPPAAEQVASESSTSQAVNPEDMPPPPVPTPSTTTTTTTTTVSKFPPVGEILKRSWDSAQGVELFEPFDPKQIPKSAARKTPIDINITEGLDADDPLGDGGLDRLAAAYGSSSSESQETSAAAAEAPIEEASADMLLPRRRGRRNLAEPLLDFNDEWERDETELEQQIEEVINDPHSDEHRKALATAAHLAHIKAEWARSLLPRREAPPNMEEIINEDEFADDPEVMHCELTQTEVDFKERIWLNANKDWLRRQQEKMYRKQMEAYGPPKRRRNRLKRPRIGEGQLTPASTPGEAAIEAMKKRGFSKRINYEAIENLFSSRDATKQGPGSVVGSCSMGDGGSSASRRTSRAGSEAGIREDGQGETAGNRGGRQAPASPWASSPAEHEAEEEGPEEEDFPPDYGEEEEYYEDDMEPPGYGEDDYADDDEGGGDFDEDYD